MNATTSFGLELHLEQRSVPRAMATAPGRSEPWQSSSACPMDYSWSADNPETHTHTFALKLVSLLSYSAITSSAAVFFNNKKNHGYNVAYSSVSKFHENSTTRREIHITVFSHYTSNELLGGA